MEKSAFYVDPIASMATLAILSRPRYQRDSSPARSTCHTPRNFTLPVTLFILLAASQMNFLLRNLVHTYPPFTILCYLCEKQYFGETGISLGTSTLYVGDTETTHSSVISGILISQKCQSAVHIVFPLMLTPADWWNPPS